MSQLLPLLDTMEASTVKNKSFPQPKPMSELLPSLTGLLSKDAMLTLTAKKQPRPTIAQTRTAEKTIKPLTLAEMRANILALKPMSPRRYTQALPSAKKKGWNSSIKVDKKIIHTADGHLKNNPVRKVLNFQPKPKTLPNQRMTVLNAETPKFPKPEFSAKKSLHQLQVKNSVRISGICNIPQTPVEIIKPNRNRLTVANKENRLYQTNLNRKLLAPPTPIHKKVATPKVDTPLLNSSWKSGSDASFLQKEKEIHEVEAKVNAVVEEQTLENIAEVSPPVSTPFKEYRSVQEYFNNSSYMETSAAAYNDNTIMCFDKPSLTTENGKREESVIVSLCDLFNKATVANTEPSNAELDNLLEVETQTENNIKLLESGIQMLSKIKESQVKSLQNVRKLIEEKRNQHKNLDNDKDKTLVATIKDTKDINNTLSPEKSPILSRPCSVIKSARSPSYKIPKKNLCLRKKVICKSLPNVSSVIQTPVKNLEGRPLNMYMKMKEQMNFLSTPMVNRELQVPDTPAVTSHNLQKQLDKLYGS